MTDRNDALSQGLHAGGFDNAYVSEDLDEAIERDEEDHEDEEDHPAHPAHPHNSAYRHAYVIGFFGTYEDSEIYSEELERLEAARAGVGDELTLLGFCVGGGEPEESEDDE